MTLTPWTGTVPGTFPAGTRDPLAGIDPTLPKGTYYIERNEVEHHTMTEDVTTNQVPTLTNIRKRNGVAGEIQVSGTVTYPGEPPAVLTFVGSAYGAPVVMITAGNPGGTFVTDPGRFGTFEADPEAWLRLFVGATV